MAKHIHSRIPEWPATSWTILTRPEAIAQFEDMIEAGTMRPGVENVVCEAPCPGTNGEGWIILAGPKNAPPTTTKG